jgi:lauroyl/myristoyl acyltransferase
VTLAPGDPGYPRVDGTTEAQGTPGGAAGARAPDTKLADPHRRGSRGPRLREKLVVRAYLAGEWILARLPLGPAARIGGWAAVASYWAWPEKRHIVESNCARVLGLPRGDRQVGRLARRIYRNQVRWVLEMMRLTLMSREELVRQVDKSIVEPFEAAWKGSNGLIVAAPHFGNNEAGAAGLAGRGWPLNAVADDTAYEELFHHLAAERRRWGVELVPWKNLRLVFRVLRRHDILILLVDWGYRTDGIPVRFFDEWTTFPAGPATLAAKTGASIVALAVIRERTAHFRVLLGERIQVASSEPAELQRATQQLATDLERMIRRAPDQWIVFKPIWPTEAADRAALAARVAAGDLGGALDGPGGGSERAPAP